MTSSAFRIVLIVCTMLWFAGCSTTPVPLDSDPMLEKDQGLLAVGFDQGGDDHVMSVVLAHQEGGEDIRISRLFSSENGLSLSLYATAAGTYCLKKYSDKFARFTAKTNSGLCAKVKPGRLTYFGHVSLSVVVGRIYQTFQYETLYEELRKDYPEVFSKYAVDIEKPQLNKIENITPASVHD